MNIEQVIKKSFNFRLNNNVGSFTLGEDEVKQIVDHDEVLTVSDSSGSGKKYVIMKKDTFDDWLSSKLEILFKNCDSIEDLEEIIKDFAEAFGAGEFADDFVKAFRKDPNNKFLEFILFKTVFNIYANKDGILEKMFNFTSDNKDIRTRAINRMVQYFDLIFIEEFTFSDFRYSRVNYPLFVFEVYRW